MREQFYGYHPRTKVFLYVMYLLPDELDQYPDKTIIAPPTPVDEVVFKFLNGAWVPEPRTFNVTVDKTTVKGDGKDTVTIGNLPEVCTIIVDDTEYPTEDPTCELTFDMPGECLIRVTAPDQYSEPVFITVI